jgi:hypothetical protein
VSLRKKKAKEIINAKRRKLVQYQSEGSEPLKQGAEIYFQNKGTKSLNRSTLETLCP